MMEISAQMLAPRRACLDEMHDAAAHELTVKLVKARGAARAFFRYQDAEAKRLGYKRQCEFAHLIAMGSLQSAPMLDEDEIEIVARWYHSLTEVNRFALVFQFDEIHGGIPWKRMRDKYRRGWNRDKFKHRIEVLLRDLGGRL